MGLLCGACDQTVKLKSAEEIENKAAGYIENLSYSSFNAISLYYIGKAFVVNA